MKKTILDFSQLKDRILHPFFSNPYLVDNRDNITQETYDFIVCERNDINEEQPLLEVLKYSNKNTKIIIDLVQESGSLDYFLDWFYLIGKNNPFYNFYLIVDCQVNRKFTNNIKILGSWKLCVLAFFENWGLINYHDSFLRAPNTKFYKKENGFLSLNGSLNVGRILLLLYFIKNNLLNNLQPSLFGGEENKNEFSFFFYTYGTNPHKFDIQEYTNVIRALRNHSIIDDDEKSLLINASKSFLPIKTKLEKQKDLESLNDFQYQLELSDKLYHKMINLVTENVPSIGDTFKNYNKSITFTEKSLKHFKTHQIPLFIGQPGLVNLMRNLGFDVFDDFVNHSYDEELDIKKRIEMVVNELSRLLLLDCVEFYNNNIKRFKNNHVNLYKLKSEAFLELSNFMYENDLL